MKKPYPIEVCAVTGEVTAILRSKTDVINYRNDHTGIDHVIISSVDTIEIEGSYDEYYRPYHMAMLADPILQKIIAHELINRFPEIRKHIHNEQSVKGGRNKKYALSTKVELVQMFIAWKNTSEKTSVLGFLNQLKKVPKSQAKVESVFLESGTKISVSTAKKYLGNYVNGKDTSNPFE